MKTIEDAARDYAIHEYWGVCEIVDCESMTDKSEEDFKAGADFAQRWISVEEELPDIGEEVLVKRELRQGDTWVQRFCSVSTRLAASGEWEDVKWSDVGHTRGIVTHWRPIELK